MSDCSTPAPDEKVLVSACLLGRACTYKATDNGDAVLARELADRGLEAIPFCPEEHGGLSTPRPPADLTAPAESVLAGTGAVRTHDGRDVTAEFLRGAEGALETCQRLGLKRAFLKERSPSCGCATTHIDGEVVEGPGLTAALLQENGVECTGVEGRRD